MTGVMNDSASRREDAPKVSARSLELLETHRPVASTKCLQQCSLLSVNVKDWDWVFARATFSVKNERDGCDICNIQREQIV